MFNIKELFSFLNKYVSMFLRKLNITSLNNITDWSLYWMQYILFEVEGKVLHVSLK